MGFSRIRIRAFFIGVGEDPHGSVMCDVLGS